MTQKFQINGLIDTSKNVLQNLNTLANASGCYLTWDANIGKWSVILNTTGTSVRTFNDDNILGAVNVSGTGVKDLYNSVSVSFPNKDIRDTTDQIVLTTPTADRFAQEIDNQLVLELNQTNDPVQAQYIANRELKQNRLDKIIEFTANYVANTIRAGDIIAVTNAPLDFVNKEFRVINVKELDADGDLVYSISAQEYNADVYTTTGLEYDYRNNFTGIKSKVFNAELDAKDDYKTGSDLGRLLAANLATGLLRSLFTSNDATDEVEQEIFFENDDTQALMTAGAKKPDLTHSGPTQVCSGSSVTVTLSQSCSSCFLTTPNYAYPYTITGITSGEIGDVPLTGTITMSGDSGSLTVTPTVTTQKTFTITVGGNSTAIDVTPTVTEYISNVTATAGTITEGGSTTINVTTVGKTDGDTLNYAITGTGTGQVSSPALTGTATVNSNATSLAISTTDGSVYFDPAKTLIVTFTPQPDDYCSIVGPNATTVTMNTNSVAPTPDKTCEYVQVPAVWCAVYNGDDDELRDMTVRNYVNLPKALAGEATVTVPLTVSVSKGNPSSISITSTVDVASSSDLGGTPFQIITAFNTVGPLGQVTGSAKSTIYGY